MQKGNKRLILYFVLLIIVLTTIEIVNQNIDNKMVINILSTMAFVVAVISLIFFIRIMRKNELNDIKVNKVIEDYVENKEFETAKSYILEKIDNAYYNNSKLRYKFLLFYIELVSGNNIEALNVLNNTKWKAMDKEIYYYKILFLIDDNRLFDANELFKKLIKVNRRAKGAYDNQINMLIKLFKYIEDGIEVEFDTQFPIVYQLFSKRESLDMKE